MRKGSCIINDNLDCQTINTLLKLSNGNCKKLRNLLQATLDRNVSENKVSKWLSANGLLSEMQQLREAYKASLMPPRREPIPMPIGAEWVSIPTHSQLAYKFGLKTFELWSPFRKQFIDPFLLKSGNNKYPAYSIVIAPNKKTNITICRLYQQCLDGQEQGVIKWQDGIGIIARQPDPFEPEDSYWSVNLEASMATQANASRLLEIKYGKNNRPSPDHTAMHLNDVESRLHH
ncbi:hypothetical protein M2G69_04275 [Vibrio vulnificus]|nr:hypothetical protein [Vibrio vulnificus]